MAAVAANCLLTEQIWNRVCGVHLTSASASASPLATSSLTWPARVTIAAPRKPSIACTGRA